MNLYDNTPIEVISGGYGFPETAAWAQQFSQGDDVTWCDYTLSAKTAGTLKNVSGRFYGTSVATADTLNLAKIKLLRPVSATEFTLVHDFDVTTQFQAVMANGLFNFDIDVSAIATALVEVGDVIGFYFGVDAGSEIRPSGNATILTGTTQKYGTGSGDQTSAAAGGVVLDNDSEANTVLAYQFSVMTNECVFFEDDNSASGFGSGAANERVCIPRVVAEPYYIIFEDVVLPDGEDISCLGIDTSAGGFGGFSGWKLDFINDKINMTNSIGTSVSNEDVDGTIQGGKKLDLLLWIDPVVVATKTNTMLFYHEKEIGTNSWGEGTTADSERDGRWVSVSDRTKINSSASVQQGNFLQISQANGVAANIGKIIVCRKPVVACGDSFVDDFASGYHALNLTGVALKTAFTEERYVINAGITAGKMRIDQRLNGNQSTCMLSRWSCQEQNLNIQKNDIVAFRNVIYAFVNCGSGINELMEADTATLATRKNLAAGLACSLGKMLADVDTDVEASNVASFGKDNGKVVANIIPYPAGTANDDIAIQTTNSRIREMCANTNTPYADAYSLIDVDNDFGFDELHPDASGAAVIATAIASAYESNKVPTDINKFRKHRWF